jgi:hypothetical protein
MQTGAFDARPEGERGRLAVALELSGWVVNRVHCSTHFPKQESPVSSVLTKAPAKAPLLKLEQVASFVLLSRSRRIGSRQ